MVKRIYKNCIYLSILLFTLFPFTLFSTNFINIKNPNSIIKINVLADDTPNIDMDELPDIPSDALNDIWYNPKIEMLIITPDGDEAFYNACIPLMEWKNEKGVKTIILNNFSSYPGRDDPERIRNMIKTYYETENIRWVLLAGDAESNLIPIRYVYNPDVYRWGGAPIEVDGDEFYKATDFYYADLTGSWDTDDDWVTDNWGEAPKDNDNDEDEIEWIPEVYVGRLPASTSGELEIMINKTIKYEKNPEVGDWMNQMLLAGAVSDTTTEEPPDGEDESRLTSYIIEHYTKLEMNYTHLHDSVVFNPPEPNFELNDTSFINKFNEGYSTVIFAGHGSYNIFTDTYNTNFFDNGDASGASNINKTSLVYASACSTAPYDYNDNNIGENLIKLENAGAIGYIGGLRTNWYFTDDVKLEQLNRGNAKLFWEEFFQNKKFQQGRALYDSKIAYIESDYYTEDFGSLEYDFERKQILTYCLLGDPEVDIYTDIPQNASNPFTEDIYEGELISFTIRDKNNRIIPYAKLHFRTLDNKYRTVYANVKGEVNFRLPAQANENYTVIITGHNLIPSYFNFTTLSDDSKPDFNDEKCSPKDPTISDNIYFEVEVQDRQSGIENVYLLQSKDKEFKEYTYYKMINRLLDEKNIYKYIIPKLKPGVYYFLVVARDWANNKRILEDESFKITILVPIMDYVLIISSLVLISIAGITIFMVYQERNKYSNTRNRLEIKKI